MPNLEFGRSVQEGQRAEQEACAQALDEHDCVHPGTAKADRISFRVLYLKAKTVEDQFVCYEL